jgi:hypothetical protein
VDVFWDEIIIFVDTFQSVDLGAPDYIEIMGAACLVALQVHRSLVCIIFCVKFHTMPTPVYSVNYTNKIAHRYRKVVRIKNASSASFLLGPIDK